MSLAVLSAPAGYIVVPGTIVALGVSDSVMLALPALPAAAEMIE